MTARGGIWFILKDQGSSTLYGLDYIIPVEGAETGVPALTYRQYAEKRYCP